jgi:RNA polymerase sigma factor (sigma-70 family)
VRDKQDAEDVVQESLAVIYGEYRGLDVHFSFAAWAFTVLRNRMLAYFDKQRGETARTTTFADDLDVPAHGHTERLANLRRRLLLCLKRIGRANIRYARIINLHHQGYGTEEICERLEITPSNFYSILSRGRDMLEKCLEETSYHDR